MFFLIETLFLGIVAGVVAAGIFFILEQKASYNRFLALLSNEINSNYKKMKGGHEKGFFFKGDIEKAKINWKKCFKEKKPPQATEWIGKENISQGYGGYLFNYLDFDVYNLFFNKGLDLFLRYNSKDNVVYSLKLLYHHKKEFSRNTQKIEESINQTLRNYSNNNNRKFKLNLNNYPQNLGNMLLYEIIKNPCELLDNGICKVDHKILLKCYCNILDQLDHNLNAEMNKYSDFKDIYQRKYSFWDMVWFYMSGKKHDKISNIRDLTYPGICCAISFAITLLLLILGQYYSNYYTVMLIGTYIAALITVILLIIQIIYLLKLWDRKKEK